MSTRLGFQHLRVHLHNIGSRQFILFYTILSLLLIAGGEAGLPVGGLRAIFVVPLLSFVPGYLTLRIANARVPETLRQILYALGLSLVLLMLWGVVINEILPLIGITDVYSVAPLTISVGALLAGLLVADYLQGNTTPVPMEQLKYIWRPWPLGLLSIPFLAVLGSRVVTRFGDNRLILCVLILIVGVVVAGYAGMIPRQYLPLAIWVIAAALLLHNSVLNHLLAWDAGKELRLARVVVENGTWSPDVGGNWMKNAMLRIVLLHPIYALLSGIDMLWEFKTVAPLLFAFAPVGFFRAYHSIAGERDAFLATVLPMAFFPFFTVLSVNSRTSASLLFLSLFAVVAMDESIQRPLQRALLPLFLFGVVVSHYGIAIIAMLAIPAAFIGNFLFISRRDETAQVNLLLTILFISIVLGWYIFVVYQGGAFNRLAGESYQLITDVQQDLSGSRGGASEAVSPTDSKTTQYATTEYTSNTIEWLQQYFLLIGGLASSGIAGATGGILLGAVLDWINRYTDAVEFDRTQKEYVFLSGGFIGVFGVTFIGVDKLNTARTLMPALLFFAPFCVLVPRFICSRVASAVNITHIKQMGRVVALTLVLVYFILNTGLFGSMTNEYHPNIMIDKDRVIEDGSLAEKNYFWAMHYGTKYKLEADNWVGANTDTMDQVVYLNDRKIMSGMYNCTNVNRQPVKPRGSCDDNPVQDVGQMDKVYVNIGSEVYYNQSYVQTNMTT